MYFVLFGGLLTVCALSLETHAIGQRFFRSTLVMELRPGTQFTLTPAYTDAFEGSAYGNVWFTRDKKGNVNALHLGADRVWDLAFGRKTTERQQYNRERRWLRTAPTTDRTARSSP